jgi:hypothetical protein
VIVGLFGANDTIKQRLAKQLKLMLESCGFTSKILCYIKDERKFLGNMTSILKSMISCEAFGLDTSFDGICFGHAMNKVGQYTMNDDKVSKGLMFISVKFAQTSFQSYITWPKKSGFFLLTLVIFVMEAFNIICWEITIQLICFSSSFMQCAGKGGNRLKTSLYKLCFA